MDFPITLTQNVVVETAIGLGGASQIITHQMQVFTTIQWRVTSTVIFYPIDLNTITDSLDTHYQHVPPQVVTSEIAVADQIIIGHEKIVIDTISLIHQTSIRKDPSTLSGDSVGVGQYINCWVERANSQGDFEFVNADVKGQYDALSPPGKLTMTYQSLSIELPTPEFGNKITYAQSRVQRQTRGGDMVIYYDNRSGASCLGEWGTKWPTTEILEFDFSYLDDENSQLLLAFMLSTIGRRITLVDYVGMTWLGFIINPETEIMQAGRFNFKANTIRFQGELQS